MVFGRKKPHPGVHKHRGSAPAIHNSSGILLPERTHSIGTESYETHPGTAPTHGEKPLKERKTCTGTLAPVVHKNPQQRVTRDNRSRNSLSPNYATLGIARPGYDREPHQSDVLNAISLLSGTESASLHDSTFRTIRA